MNEDGARGTEPAPGASGVFDPLAGDGQDEPHAAANRPPSGESIGESGRTDGHTEAGATPKAREPMVKFWLPSELRAFEPPANQNIAGDFHVQRGAITVLAGPPGCGKSRAALWLGIHGAAGRGNWLGFDVHCQFRTLILQNENGVARLHRDFAQLDLPDSLDDWLRVSAPPTMGLNMANIQFRAELKAAVRAFAPHLVVIDPWNALARDAMEKDYQEAFEKLREVLAESPENPACLIVHHLRKPKSEDRQRGRGLGNLLAGSYTIISVPRAVVVLQPASDDVEDSRVVVTPAKNNDGELGQRTAWERRNGLFVPVDDFDWTQYDEGDAKPREAKVREEHVRQVFDSGRVWLDRAEVVRTLESIAKVGRTAAYDALKTHGGRFSEILTVRDDGKIGLRPPRARDEAGE